MLGLRCKACHAHNTATAAPQNQLHLANCTRRKICVVGCDVARGVLHASNSAFRSLRKINCSLQNALVEKAVWCVAMCYASHPPLRKINCTLQKARAEKAV
jgi:hypothetical protein